MNKKVEQKRKISPKLNQKTKEIIILNFENTHKNLMIFT